MDYEKRYTEKSNEFDELSDRYDCLKKELEFVSASMMIESNEAAQLKEINTALKAEVGVYKDIVQIILKILMGSGGERKHENIKRVT